jgi:hypothetical protein
MSALELIDYLDNYKFLCQDNDRKVIPSVVSLIQQAIDDG